MNRYYGVWELLYVLPYAFVYSILSHIWFWMMGKPKASRMPQITGTFTDKVAIVTGANSGIGFETTKALVVKHGMTVIMACMSRDEAEEAAEIINALVPPESTARAIFIHTIDLSSYASVHDFAIALKENFGPKSIDVLVNNAGCTFRLEKSVDGLDLGYQVNFLGHFLLTSLIVDRLVDGARVINTTSATHHFCGGPFGKDFTTEKGWVECAQADTLLHSYPVSKLALLFFTVCINRKFPRSRLYSIAVDPGAVNSNLWNWAPKYIRFLWSRTALTTVQGAQCTIFASIADLDPQEFFLEPYFLPEGHAKAVFPPHEVTGPYVGPCIAMPRLPRKEDQDAVYSAFWKVSSELTGAKWLDFEKDCVKWHASQNQIAAVGVPRA